MSDLNSLTEDFFNGVFGYEPDDPRINVLDDYTDENGIRHIWVNDTNEAWELINGEWVVKAPF